MSGYSLSSMLCSACEDDRLALIAVDISPFTRRKRAVGVECRGVGQTEGRALGYPDAPLGGSRIPLVGN